MIVIHDWQAADLPLPIFNERRVARRCARCGKFLTLRERDAEVICPPEEEARRMFAEPVLCEEEP